MTTPYEVDYQAAEHTQPCKCCGKSSIILWRDIYPSGGGEQTAAVYFEITPHAKADPPVGYVLFEDDEHGPAFRFRVYHTPRNVGVGLEDGGAEGRPCLSREQALADPRWSDVTAILDVVIPGDGELMRMLEHPGYDS
jgi:hypothetical protein